MGNNYNKDGGSSKGHQNKNFSSVKTITSAERKVIKIAKTSDPFKTAGAIRKFLSQYGECELHSVGQTATSMAVKALAQLTSRYKSTYSTTIDYLHFMDDKGQEQQGMRFVVRK